MMTEPRTFTLTQLKHLLAENDDQLVGNYISQHLAIARRIELSAVEQQFRQGPLKMPEMRMLIVKKGWVEPIINLTSHHLEAGELIFLAPNGIVQLDNAAADVRGMGLSMSDDLFSLAIGNHIPKAFDGHLREFHFHLEPHELAFLDHIHYLLYMNMSDKDHSPQVTLHLLSTFLWYVDYLWSRHEEANRLSQTREQRLFADFIQLVNKDAVREHQIDYYASRLCLSARYMSTLIKKVSGHAAKDWIDDALVTHAKIALKHSNKSVAQISEELNFPNPSFFSKFFRRMTSMTPSEYRGRA